MKRGLLETYLNKKVEVTIFTGESVVGELHKTGEEKFKNDPNFYIPHNYYFCTNSQSFIFKCSHATKIKEIL